VAAVAAIICTAGAASRAPQSAHADSTSTVQGVAVGEGDAATSYDRLIRMGTNTLYLMVFWEADGPDATDVHKYDGTAPDATILTNIQQATARGLRVVFMPMIYCNGCDGGWRGNLNPSDPDLFMQNYTQHMLLYYAQLVRQSGVWLFSLGSEMNYLQPYADDWRQAATEVRRDFTGLVTYQPNWDHVDRVDFWDALDIVTVSAYFPLTSKPSPSVDDLKRAWRSSNVPGWKGQNWVGVLQRIVDQTGKRLLISEVGYRSTTVGAEYPYDEANPTQTSDQLTQANAYQALLETFSAQPWFMGVIWWEWRGDDSGADNGDMSPRGKLAEQFLTQWWVNGWRPSPGSPTPHYDFTGGGDGPGDGPGGGSSVLAAQKRALSARPAGGTTPTAGATTTTPLTPGDPAAAAVNDGGFSAAAAGPRSVAHLASGSDSRSAPVAVALFGLFGVAFASVSVGLRRARLPGSRPLA